MPGHGRFRPASGRTGPSSKSGRLRPMLGELVEADPSVSGEIGPNAGRKIGRRGSSLSPMWVTLGPSLTEFDWLRPQFGQILPGFGQICAISMGVGPIWAIIGLHSPRLHNPQSSCLPKSGPHRPSQVKFRQTFAGSLPTLASTCQTRGNRCRANSAEHRQIGRGLPSRARERRIGGTPAEADAQPMETALVRPSGAPRAVA